MAPLLLFILALLLIPVPLWVIFYRKRQRAIRAILPEDELLLERYFMDKIPYYRRLQPEDARKFCSRAAAFLRFAEFSTRKELVLQPEMTWMAAASLVQVTMGLDSFLPEDFHKVIFYPGEYYSARDKRMHKGEVNLSGAIVLSWKSLQEGMADPHDNLNLGLHEMAHALRFNGVRGSERDPFFAVCFDRWLALAKERRAEQQAGGKAFFREYATTNIDEYFAVCIEYFFESPAAFRKEEPALYRMTCILLNQDPAAEGYLRFDAREVLLKEQDAARRTLYLNRNIVVRFVSGPPWVLFLFVASTVPFFFSGMILLSTHGEEWRFALVAGLFFGLMLLLYIRRNSRYEVYSDRVVVQGLFGPVVETIGYHRVFGVHFDWVIPSRGSPHYTTTLFVVRKGVQKIVVNGKRLSDAQITRLYAAMQDQQVPITVRGGWMDEKIRMVDDVFFTSSWRK